jgi:alkanesulfonate monooxygenase SsuD/methylene tetrahydromethanopterin reductase-like flavin-dependent oxidoreductase (luciferase family)
VLLTPLSNSAHQVGSNANQEGPEVELGVCVRDADARELIRLGRFAEDHGLREVYVPDVAAGGGVDPSGRLIGRDAFTGLAAMFASTTTVRGAVGVAAAIAHHPRTLALVASTLHELSGERFTLGVGVSHHELAAGLGVRFPPSPVVYMRGVLEQLAAWSRDGVSFGAGWPVLLGALGPRMTRLGAETADGVVLNWMTPEHAAVAVRSVRQAAPPGRTPRTVLYVRLMAADAVHRDAVAYDALANYHRHFVAQGLDGPAEIVSGTTLPLDDLGAAHDRLAQYAASGLDLLCIYPHGLAPAERDRVLAALAGS